MDLDGVLYDTIGGIVDNLARRHGVEISREAIKNYKELTGDLEINSKIWEMFKSPNFYFGLKPYPFSLEALSILAGKGKIIVVSSRPQSAAISTRAAIARDFGKLVQSMYCTSVKTRVAKSERSRYAVEDNPKQAMEYAENRIRTWLIRTSYTGSVSEGRFLRLADNVLEAAKAMVRPLGIK